MEKFLLFFSYMAALKMPKTTEEEKEARDQAMQNGIVEAIEVPLSVIKTINKSWPAVNELARHCNISCASDIQVRSSEETNREMKCFLNVLCFKVGVKCLETGAWGAYQNILTNLKDLKDEKRKETLESNAKNELETTVSNCANALQIVDSRINAK